MTWVSIVIVCGGKLPQQHHAVIASQCKIVRARSDVPASTNCAFTQYKAVAVVEFGECTGHTY